MKQTAAPEEPILFHVGESFTRTLPESPADQEWHRQFQARVEQFFNVVVGDGSWLRPNPDYNSHFAQKFVQHATVHGQNSFIIRRCEANVPQTVLVRIQEQSTGQVVELHINLQQLMSARHLGYFRSFPSGVPSLSAAAASV